MVPTTRVNRPRFDLEFRLVGDHLRRGPHAEELPTGVPSARFLSRQHLIDTAADAGITSTDHIEIVAELEAEPAVTRRASELLKEAANPTDVGCAATLTCRTTGSSSSVRGTLRLGDAPVDAVGMGTEDP